MTHLKYDKIACELPLVGHGSVVQGRIVVVPVKSLEKVVQLLSVLLGVSISEVCVDG